jgi:hypothetical protein
VGIAFSPDGRYAYVSNEAANPTDPGYNPTACNTPTGIGTGTTPGPAGTLTVIDLRKAERDPAQSVLASVYAGCSPVRVVLSEDGRVAWVTARAEDNVLAFSTGRLLSDPSHARLSTTPVGVAPVGIQLLDHDRLIAVADSNRFTTGQAGSVSILDYRKALHGAGASATVGTFASGDFPRQRGLVQRRALSIPDRIQLQHPRDLPRVRAHQRRPPVRSPPWLRIALRAFRIPDRTTLMAAVTLAKTGKIVRDAFRDRSCFVSGPGADDVFGRRATLGGWVGDHLFELVTEAVAPDPLIQRVPGTVGEAKRGSEQAAKPARLATTLSSRLLSRSRATDTATRPTDGWRSPAWSPSASRARSLRSWRRADATVALAKSGRPPPKRV